MTIGLISDTHGLLRESAVAALAGSDHIIHAGDVGGPEIIQRLSDIAPITVVRGNIDTDPWGNALPETALVEAGELRIYVLHDLKQIRIHPADTGYQVVVSGHSHKPAEERRNGVLYVNPGSAGPRRFRLPITLAKLYISGANVRAEVVNVSPQ